MTMRPRLSEWRMYRRAVTLLSRYIPRFFLWIALHGALMALVPFVELILLARVADTLSTGGDASSVWLLSVIALAVLFLTALAEAWFRRAKEAKWELLYRAVDRLLVDKLLSMDQAEADDPSVRGQLKHIKEVTEALGGGLVRLPDIIQDLCRGFVGALTATILSVIILPTMPIERSLPMILLWIFLLVMTVWGSERARRKRQTSSQRIVDIDRVYYAFLETMSDSSKAADMRLYRQDRTVARYLEEAEQRFFEKQGLKRRRAHGLSAVGRALAASLPTLWIGCSLTLMTWMFLEGAIGLGAFLGGLGAWCALPRTWGWLVQGASIMRENAVELAMLFRFLDTPHRLYQGSLTTEKRADREYEITFRHVSFTYPSQATPALSDVSVTLRSGSRTAIVGENGSGKSTFIKLLCRLYDPDEGEILLNGIDIRKYRREEYIGLLAVVFQDFQLFDRPVAENVAGSSDPDEERVAQCLRDAGADAVALLSQTDIRSLSDGDAQKTAIARALYKDAPFLLLDEPTASLDPAEEAALYANLDRIIDDRTAVYVSHRLASCRFCDEILVLEDGRLTEQGTHEALLSQKGRYHAMWTAQAMYYKENRSEEL